MLTRLIIKNFKSFKEETVNKTISRPAVLGKRCKLFTIFLSIL